MLKKLLLLIVVITTVAAQTLAATGDWHAHPYYVGSNIKNIIDTDSKIYYLAGNDLFCFDKSTQENVSVNKRTNLNDVLATNIYYNHDKHYLVVTYINSDIDVMYDDGQVVNLPDIKDMVLAGAKGINDVTFSNGKIYVATEFGFVVYNDETMVVDEARLLNVNYASVIQTGEWTIVSRYSLFYAGRTSEIKEYDWNYKHLSAITQTTNPRMYPVNDNKFIVNGDNGVIAYTIGTDESNAPIVVASDTICTTKASLVQRTPSGFVISLPTSRITLDNNAANPQWVTTSAELFSSNPNGDGTMWGLNANGLHKVGSDTHYKPNGIGIKVGAFYMTYNKPKNLVYVSASSDNMFADWGYKQGAVTQIFTYDGSLWKDVTPTSLPGNGVSANWQLAMDPMDSCTYVYPSRKYGVFKITNDQFAYQYNATNSYFGSSFYKGACAFDSEGNLWVVYSSASASAAAVNVSVLPRAKYEQATCTKSDWIPVEVPATRQKAFKGSSFVIGKDDVKVFNSGAYQTSFAFWNQTDGLNSEPSLASYGSLTDQDGKSVTWDYVYCMERDNNGIIWAGLDNGVIAFDPSKSFDDNFTIDHLKVPRNDGTGLSDNLLDGIQVNCIAVDAANRKWIGTNTTGLYQVSPDGSKILHQFNTENSYLTSNTVYAVCCNTNTNSVFVLTPSGMLEFMGDTSPAADNYDNVYIYPNPVRPDFTGMLTINNLMSNSYLTITNASGNIVKQLQSNGGMATWDCCDEQGERMPTGLYSVSATQQANGSNAVKVGEFLIIK